MNYPELLLALIKSESIISPRGEKTKELMNVSFQCSAQENAYDFYGVRGINKLTDYWFKELAWFMSGVRDTEFIEQHAKLWKNIKNADGTANSNYGWLVFYNKNEHGVTPYEWAKTSLLHDEHSRKAVITKLFLSVIINSDVLSRLDPQTLSGGCLTICFGGLWFSSS